MIKNINYIRELLGKQHYALIGKHSAVQICRWTKKSLLDEGFCYKEKFYSIKSHLCCQMSPSVVFCQNRCIHCWRAIEYTIGTKINKKEVDEPKEIIENCIFAQRKLLSGFKGNKKINLKKFYEAQNPTQFAISLIGEPTLYPLVGNLVEELRNQGKTSFLVTNGLFPEKLKELQKNNQLPTQLYISLNTPNKKMYENWHKSQIKDAWNKFNKSLRLFPKLSTRKVIRLTLVRNLNMLQEKNYAKLIKKAMPDFVEVKSYMAVGFARQRLGYETMPSHQEIQEFAKKLEKQLSDLEKQKKQKYKILNEKQESRVVLLGKDENNMKIKKSEI